MNSLLNNIRRQQDIETMGAIELIPLMRFNYWWARIDVIQASDINGALDTINKYGESIMAFIRIDQIISDTDSAYDYCYCNLTSIIRNDNTKNDECIKCTNYTFSRIGGIDCPVLYIRPQYRNEDPNSYINSYTTDPVTGKPIIQEPDDSSTPFYWGYNVLSIDSSSSPPVLKETATLATLVVENLDEWNNSKGNDRDGMFIWWFENENLINDFPIYVNDCDRKVLAW